LLLKNYDGTGQKILKVRGNIDSLEKTIDQLTNEMTKKWNIFQ
jgi:uncharacterized protein Yka (UPF0111/DUF47 family)